MNKEKEDSSAMNIKSFIFNYFFYLSKKNKNFIIFFYLFQKKIYSYNDKLKKLEINYISLYSKNWLDSILLPEN